MGNRKACAPTLPSLLPLRPRADGCESIKLITCNLGQCETSAMMRFTLIFMAFACLLIAASHIGVALVFQDPPLEHAGQFILIAASNLLGAWVCGPSKTPRKHVLRP
jgi:hypothetical protein